MDGFVNSRDSEQACRATLACAKERLRAISAQYMCICRAYVCVCLCSLRTNSHEQFVSGS